MAGLNYLNQLIFNNKIYLTDWTWANQILSLFDRQGQVQHGPQAINMLFTKGNQVLLQIFCMENYFEFRRLFVF